MRNRRYEMPKQHGKKQSEGKQSELEKQYAEMFSVVLLPANWSPLPESMSLEQPSPYIVVPLVSGDSTTEPLIAQNLDT